MNTQKRYSAEFRERAVRLAEEQQKEGATQWGAMQSISKKLGCAGGAAPLDSAAGTRSGEACRLDDG